MTDGRTNVGQFVVKVVIVCPDKHCAFFTINNFKKFFLNNISFMESHNDVIFSKFQTVTSVSSLFLLLTPFLRFLFCRRRR